MSRQLYLGAQLRAAKRIVYQQVTASTVVTEIFNRENEAVDLDAVESLQSGERHLFIGRGEVEVGRETASVARSKLSQRGAALENQAACEEPGVVKQMQRVILGNVEKSGIASTPDALIVAREVSLGNPGHDPVPTVRYRCSRRYAARCAAARGLVFGKPMTVSRFTREPEEGCCRFHGQHAAPVGSTARCAWNSIKRSPEP